MFKAVLPISIIIALRFLGLFIVLPVLSVYALNLSGANELLVGITLGCYAVSQMMVQIPFGSLSDKIGRKEIIFIGTIIFIAGSIICAYSSSIYMLIFGRFVQGMGAIGAVGTAMISDLVKEEQRAKAMAFMGICISLSFAISMILGPLIGGFFGVDKLFLITAILGILSLFLLKIVPNPPNIKTTNSEKVNYMGLMLDPSLARMNITNLLQKSFMTATFLTIPLIMTKLYGWEKKELWIVYLPALIFGFLAMLPAVYFGEKKRKSKMMLIIGILFFATSYLIMAYARNEHIFIIGVVIFFIGFNIHEPLMQSLASKYTKVNQRGASLGLFNMFGYFGTFIGGVGSGIFLKYFGILYSAWFVCFLCFIWFIFLLTLKNPEERVNFYIPFLKVDFSRVSLLDSARGVVEWYENKSEKILVVKYDKTVTDEETIKEIVST